MDSELDAQQTNQLLRALYADPELRAHWTAYHVAGDALRSDEVASSHSASFCVRVSAAIAQEPTVLAPRVAARVQAARRYLAPGLAVAASVAVIGFVAVPLMRSQAPAPVQQQAAIAPPPAVVPAEGAQRRAAATVSNARAMQAYLAAHRELTNGVALPRATPYLRATAEQPEGR